MSTPLATTLAPPDSRGPENRTIDAVQMLRGFAALLVVLYHAKFTINGPAYLDLGDRLFMSGARGVDLFFVISGFIMVHVTVTSKCTRRDITAFLIKRWARIWPPYAIATLAILVCDPELPLVPAMALSVAKALAFYPQIRSGAPFYGWAPLVVGWTLMYEIYFYLMMAASMVFHRRRWLALTALFGVALLGVPLAAGKSLHVDAYANYNLYPAFLNIVSNPMMWEFAAGALIGAIYHSRFRIRSEFALKVMVAASTTIFVWHLLLGGGRHGPTQWGALSAVLLLCYVLAHKQIALRIPTWMVWLGDISYSLYLVHRIVQLGMLSFFPRIGLGYWLAGAPFFLGSTAVSLIVAAISHRLVERGLSEWIRHKLMARFVGLAPRAGAV